jgi:hypothetical protein
MCLAVTTNASRVGLIDEVYNQVSSAACSAQGRVDVLTLAEATLNESHMGIGFQDSLDLIRLHSMFFPDLALDVLQPDDSIDAHAVASRDPRRLGCICPIHFADGCEPNPRGGEKQD